MRSRPTTSVGAVTTYLIATDSDDLFGLLDAAIGGTASLIRVSSGQAVRPAVRELEPDLVVLDLQIGTMGAMAVCKDLRLEEGDRVVVVGGLRFEPNQAKMTKGLEAKLRMAAQKARSNDRLDRVIVEVYGDSGQPPAAAEKLAALRATAVRAVLVAAGLSNDVLTVATGDSGAKRSKSAPHVEVLVVRRRPPSESKPKPSAPSEAGGSR